VVGSGQVGDVAVCSQCKLRKSLNRIERKNIHACLKANYILARKVQKDYIKLALLMAC
jgi:exosome complex RNA-binding protein Csl4